jgi:hypothetical protein
MGILCILVLAFAGEPAMVASDHQIRGVVIDATGAGLPGASVRVLQSESNAELSHATADHDGVFQIGNLEPGSFLLTAWLQGFRTRRVAVVVLADTEVTDVGKIRIELAGCDAPGVICDSFGISPTDPVARQGYLQLKVNCSLALSAGKVYCPNDLSGPSEKKKADLLMTRDEGGVYLTAINGAAFAAPNLPRGDCRDAYPRETKIRIDGLGPGDDICLHTHDQHWSHVFLTSDVTRDSQQIDLWQLTRKR